jgi:hypothetical protein
MKRPWLSSAERRENRPGGRSICAPKPKITSRWQFRPRNRCLQVRSGSQAAVKPRQQIWTVAGREPGDAPHGSRSLVSGGTSSGNPPPTRQMAGCGTRDFRAPWDPRAGRRLITAPRNPCSFHQLVGEPVPRRLDPLEQDQVLSLTTAVDGLHGEVDVMAAPAHRRRTAAYLSYLRANKS